MRQGNRAGVCGPCSQAARLLAPAGYSAPEPAPDPRTAAERAADVAHYAERARLGLPLFEVTTP